MTADGGIDYESLGRYLRVLAVPNRLVLLHKLQLPHAVADIELKPFRKAADRNPDRPLSRQAVRKHLHRLEAAGLVESRVGERDGREVTEYLVHQPRLFTIVDEFKRLSRIRPAPDVAPDATAGRSTATGGRGAAVPDGPALVLVGGMFEGRAFPLEGDGPWRVGRARDVAVSLPYDPFVSGANSEIRRDGDRLVIVDLPGSRNGTRVNWAPLDDGERRVLVPGDTVGVGRSLLVFRRG